MVIIEKAPLIEWHYEKDKYLPRIMTIVAHEASHVVTMLFSDCSVVIDDDNQECEAYMQGYVTSCITDYLVNDLEFIENEEKDEKTGRSKGGTILCS